MDEVDAIRHKLSEMVRQIGEEEQSSSLEIRWTKMESMVRRLFNMAITGNIEASRLLGEWGWNMKEIVK